ncbi:unnamed protein product, partial [Ectocarpus fasciculatus]
HREGKQQDHGLSRTTTPSRTKTGSTAHPRSVEPLRGRREGCCPQAPSSTHPRGRACRSQTCRLAGGDPSSPRGPPHLRVAGTANRGAAAAAACCCCSPGLPPPRRHSHRPPSPLHHRRGARRRPPRRTQE